MAVTDPTKPPVEDAAADVPGLPETKPKAALGASIAPVPQGPQTPAGGPATATADPMAFVPQGGGANTTMAPPAPTTTTAPSIGWGGVPMAGAGIPLSDYGNKDKAGPVAFGDFSNMPAGSMMPTNDDFNQLGLKNLIAQGYSHATLKDGHIDLGHDPNAQPYETVDGVPQYRTDDAPDYSKATGDYAPGRQEEIARQTAAGINPATGKPFDTPVAADPRIAGPGRYITGGQEVGPDGKPIPGGYSAAADQARQFALQGFDANGLPMVGGPSGGGRPAPAGPAADTGVANIPGGRTLGPEGAGGVLTEGTGLGGAAGGDQYRGGITNTDPGNSLLGKTLLAGPETDRYKIAGDKFKTWQDENDPYFQAKLRQASQQAAGRGQVGSGMARGALGDIGQQYAREGRNAGQSFLQNALEGSIGDSYKNIDIAHNQQKFQQGQQESAFNQQVIQSQVQEALKNGDFNRAMQLLQAGNQGNPSDTALGLSGVFGSQANGANAALAGLVGNTVNRNAQTAGGGTGGIPSWLTEYIKSIGGGGTGYGSVGEGRPQ